MSNLLLSDIDVMKAHLATLPTDWEGKACVLEMKEADFQWRQMEWWAFYFELLCMRALAGTFSFPGDRYGNVSFDMKRSLNWDIKAKAIRSDSHMTILNDQTAIDASIAAYGHHGVLIGLCDVEYNDADRTFQKWHTELKGGLSAYEEGRIARTSTSRYRKTRARLTDILFLSITPEKQPFLGTMRQGRNSNGMPRAPKYMLDIEQAEPFLIDRLVFS